jgi:tRNA pseudouridine38-40 synthase
MNIRIVLAYDGQAYVGWQRQSNGISVQEKLEEVLSRIAEKKVQVEGASRTDTGVHALGMTASFRWDRVRPSGSELHRAVNALLPGDIRVTSLAKAPLKFHARFSAKRKLYRYRILCHPTGDAFRRLYTWHVSSPLNLFAMRKAARSFVGKMDFSSVAANPGYDRTTMVRTIFRCAVLRKPNDEIHIEVEGDGFLYKMVRTIVGTLVDVGKGKRDAESISTMLNSRDRRLAGKTAPAQGLYLVHVKYH